MVDANTLPLGARGPGKDVPAGFTETGQPMYQGVTGQRYTLREVTPSSQWTTEAGTMARVGEVAKYRLRELGESIVSGVTAPVRALRGEPVTQGEAMNTAGMALVGSAPVPVPEGSLRIFGGPKARGINKEELFRFVRKSKNENPEELWAELGWLKNKNGEVRFEIPDNEAKLNPFKRVKEYYPLKDILEHKKLYEAYPELRDVRIVDADWLNDSDLFGQVDYTSDNKPFIVVRNNLSNEEKLRVILHEVEHIVQAIEDPNFEVNYRDSTAQFGYWNSPEELEARLVESRQMMTPEERRKSFPYSLTEIGRANVETVGDTGTGPR